MRAPDIAEEPRVGANGRQIPWLMIGLGAVLVLVTLVGLALVGELNSFLTGSLNVLPFLGLAILASLGETRPWARMLAYLYLVLLGLAILGGSTMFVAIAQLGPLVTMPGQATRDALLAGLRPVLSYLGLGTVLLALALLPLAPPFRRWAARWLPIRPHSVSDTVGLSAVLMLASLPLAALAVLGGHPPLLTMMTLPGMEATMAARSPVRQQLELIYGLVWLLPASLVIVGYPIRRQLGQAVARLGLVWPSVRQVALALVVAVVLVVAANGLDIAINWLWAVTGWPHTDTALFERLMGGLISPAGALVVGVTAGLGEEVAVRGVLQPRVGLLLANLAFTAIHAYQYGFDGLLSVFLVGLALGVLRHYTNTTTSAITHGTYNFILIMSSVVGQ